MSALVTFLKVIEFFVRFTVNLFLLVLLLALFGALAGKVPPLVPDDAVLVVAPQGLLVEEYSTEPLDRALNRLVGDENPETRVIDLLDALHAARDDERIKVVSLETDGLFGGSLAKLQEISAALLELRESGKHIIAAGSGFTQGGYLLAANANEIHMHPMGFVFVTGFSSYRNYYREGIEKIGAEWNIFRAGEYKSYGEPYVRDSMSPEAREANQALIDTLWRFYEQDAVTARDLDPDALTRYVDEFLPLLEASDGDLAEMALAYGLVDQLSTRDQVDKRLAELVSASNPNKIKRIGMEDYLLNVRQDGLTKNADSAIGVVVASGTIVGGGPADGVADSESLSKRLAAAVADDSIKALVLRVDSPGGSSFASDLILRDVELVQEAGKPVIVSMSGVAASGGYWISMSADEIWASPSSITGSIGVVAMFPTFEGTLNKLGIHTDGVETSELAGAFRPDRDLPESAKKVLQMSVDSQYEDFIEKVASHRGIDASEVRQLAAGRVWSGDDAYRLGLVDRMGGMTEAIEAAAERVGIADDYSVKVIEPELGFTDQLLINLLSSRIALSARHAHTSNQWNNPYMGLLHNLRSELTRLAGFSDPAGLYLHCFCDSY